MNTDQREAPVYDDRFYLALGSYRVVITSESTFTLYLSRGEPRTKENSGRGRGRERKAGDAPVWGAKAASHIAAHVKRRLSVHAEAESPSSSLHLSLDHLSLAGHVLVVSPYTSSRVAAVRARQHTVRIVVGACTHRPSRLASDTHGARDAETAVPGCRRICRPAISRAAFARNFNSQIDPRAICRRCSFSLFQLLSCAENLRK